MNIIIPMAGMGTRMRPHTLTLPKPLIPIAGKPIVQRLVEDIANVCQEGIEKVGFVIGRFGEQVENQLKEIAASVGAEGRIFYQGEALGTAHAILCAGDILEGNTIVAYADTLFRADFQLDTSKDGIIWVQKVEDPSAFGVVEMNEDKEIIGFVEKPRDFVSDLAIIGIYFVKEGTLLKNAIQYLVDNDLKENGEYQLTNALQDMKEKGLKFVPGEVSDWLDCGNKDATVMTNQKYLDFISETEGLISPSAKKDNSVIIPPVYLGKNVKLRNSVLGPYVSVGENTVINDSRIENSIIQNDSSVSNANIANSMIGNFVNFQSKSKDLSIGDFCTVID